MTSKISRYLESRYRNQALWDKKRAYIDYPLLCYAADVERRTSVIDGLPARPQEVLCEYIDHIYDGDECRAYSPMRADWNRRAQ